MNKGDLVLIDAPPRLDYGLFIERLPFDRMAAVELIKERGSKGYVAPDTKGIRYLTSQKNLKVILTAQELQRFTFTPQEMETMKKAASFLKAKTPEAAEMFDEVITDAQAEKLEEKVYEMAKTAETSRLRAGEEGSQRGAAR